MIGNNFIHFDTLKINDSVSIYCTGELVTGVIIEKTINSITVKHRPLSWGNDTLTQTTASIVQSWTSNPEKLMPHCFKDNLPVMG